MTRKAAAKKRKIHSCVPCESRGAAWESALSEKSIPSTGASTPVAIAPREHEQRPDERVDEELEWSPAIRFGPAPAAGQEQNGTSIRSKKTTKSARSCARAPRAPRDSASANQKKKSRGRSHSRRLAHSDRRRGRAPSSAGRGTGSARRGRACSGCRARRSTSGRSRTAGPRLPVSKRATSDDRQHERGERAGQDREAPDRAPAARRRRARPRAGARGGSRGGRSRALQSRK